MSTWIAAFSLTSISRSPLLSLLAAAAVALAARRLSISVPLNRRLRALILGLAGYGFAAFVHAWFVGAPFSAVVRGDSLWHALPVVLRGATIGGFVILPLAFVVAVVRLGLRRAPDGTLARLLHEVVALGAACVMVIACLPFGRRGSFFLESTSSADLGVRDVRPSAAAAVQFENSLRALEDAARRAPRDRWDPDYVVNEVGNDPDTLFGWVRDNTVWVPYRGALRGAVGVLMDRQGNALDRALLLATLLDKAGREVRLAHGHLSRDKALAVLPDVEPVAISAPRESLESGLTTAAVSQRLDHAIFGPTVRTQSAALEPVLSRLDNRVEEQAGRLLTQVRTAAKPARDARDAAIAQLQDHWWVQFKDSGDWRDLDLNADEDALGRALTTPESTHAVADLPASIHHEVAIRVVTAYASDRGVAERTVLDQVLRPSELIGRPVALQFWPTDWPNNLALNQSAAAHLFQARASDQRRWVAVLTAGRSVLAQGAFQDTGEAESLGGNPFGSLGSTSTRIFKGAPGSTTNWLAAAYVEYELRTPGAPPRTIRRAVFDFVDGLSVAAPPDAQQISTRGLALMMRTEIVLLPCQPSAEFVSHLAVQSLSRNHGLLQVLNQREVALDGEKLLAMVHEATDTVSPLYTLALARLEWSTVGDKVFVDRPTILARHRFPAIDGDRASLVDATDIVSNEVGADFNAPDQFALRVRQGVFDTNAEAVLNSSGPSNGSAADALASATDWIILTPSDRAELQGLGVRGDVQRRMERELDAGRIVVAPRQALQHGGASNGWWSIDAETGDTLGIGARGWGQALAERAVTIHPLIDMGSNLAFEYAFCQAVPQVLNQALPFFNNYREALPWVAWLGPIDAKHDAAQVYRDNRRECMMSAMVTTGITATLPLILTVLRSRQMTRMVSACFVTGTMVTTDLGRVAIEEVKVGQFVLSRNPQTGEQVYKRVDRVMVKLNRPALELTVRNSRGRLAGIGVTGEHLIWVLNHGWTPARGLHPGDVLLSGEGERVNVEHVDPIAAATVYNLEVHEFHTYFVGPDQVWVHNNCGTKLPKYLRNKLSRIRNEAAAGGMRGIDGAVNAREALKLGEAFVGPGYRTTEVGLMSADGLRQFRVPTEKFGIDWINGGQPFSRTGVQVNFQSRLVPQGNWPSNVHLDVLR